MHDEDARYVARPDALPEGGLAISFRAVATFLVDAVDRRAHLDETVGVTRPRRSDAARALTTSAPRAR